MENSIKEKLLVLLNNRLPLSEASEKLLELKNLGLNQADANEEIVEFMKSSSMSEATYDWALEILDIVHNYCQERFRVWW